MNSWAAAKNKLYYLCLMKRNLPAEWAPQSMVQFTFPHEGTDWAAVLPVVVPCFVACITAVSRFEPVLVVCDEVAKTQRYFEGHDLSRIHFVALPSNDTWARDHAAITVEEDGRPLLVDFVFNGWGLKFPADQDNLISRRLHGMGVFGGAEMEHGGMVLEGGGIESDGLGTLMTTTECMLSPNRNPHLTQADIEAHLGRALGAERVLWLHHGYLAGDDTDSHIDTLARFCDPGTIAYVRCTDERDEHYAALKAMEAELQGFRKADGQRYGLVPLPMASACYDEEGHRLPATYANFLIVNGAVLVPTYRVPEDEAALAQLAACFPDREIVPIDCYPLILQHGSLHCITMQFPASVGVSA